MSGNLPNTGPAPIPPGRFAVKLDIADKGQGPVPRRRRHGQRGAIYTEHAEAIHILRKIILRVGSYTNYLILKLH